MYVGLECIQETKLEHFFEEISQIRHVQQSIKVDYCSLFFDRLTESAKDRFIAFFSAVNYVRICLSVYFNLVYFADACGLTKIGTLGITPF